MAAYGSSKAAVMNLTLHMAHQWGPEVRVNCIAPGTIDTPRPAGTQSTGTGSGSSQASRAGKTGPARRSGQRGFVFCVRRGKLRQRRGNRREWRRIRFAPFVHC